MKIKTTKIALFTIPVIAAIMIASVTLASASASMPLDTSKKIGEFGENVEVLITGLSPDGKVTLCHIPPGNPENAHTITVSPSAVPAHLAHGDFIGTCERS